MKTTQKGTEGILNDICARYNINYRQRTISVQALKKAHKPKTEDHLRRLISDHHKDNPACKCGCVANGSLDDWANNLFAAYNRYRREVDNNIAEKNLEDCRIYIQYLFVGGSLIGGDMEEKALKVINTLGIIKDYSLTVNEATEDEDFNYAVDLTISENNKIICGVQVKPVSYKYCKQSIRDTNYALNANFGKPVIYIYYDRNYTFVQSKHFTKQLSEALNAHKTVSIPAVTY